MTRCTASSGIRCRRAAAWSRWRATLIWRRRRWVLVAQFQQERLGDPSSPRYVLTTLEPRGGRMVTVSVDTSAYDAAADPRGAGQ